MTSATPPVLALPEASDALSSRLAEGLERVEALIVERTRNEDDFITEANLHLARAGGKRFRPVLTMLVAELGEKSGRTAVADAVRVIASARLSLEAAAARAAAVFEVRDRPVTSSWWNG